LTIKAACYILGTMKKLLSLILALACCYVCPVTGDCGEGQACCGHGCCSSDLSAGHCQAPVADNISAADALPLPVLVNHQPVPADRPAEFIARQVLPFAPNLCLLIESKLFPHTGPPACC
jgi:hypothetical protein